MKIYSVISCDVNFFKKMNEQKKLTPALIERMVIHLSVIVIVIVPY